MVFHACLEDSWIQGLALRASSGPVYKQPLDEFRVGP